MPILFRCDHCARKLSVGSKKAGHEVRCPRCKSSLVVPTVSLGAPDAASVKPDVSHGRASGLTRGWSVGILAFASLGSVCVALPSAISMRGANRTVALHSDGMVAVANAIDRDEVLDEAVLPSLNEVSSVSLDQPLQMDSDRIGLGFVGSNEFTASNIEEDASHIPVLSNRALVTSVMALENAPESKPAVFNIGSMSRFVDELSQANSVKRLFFEKPSFTQQLLGKNAVVEPMNKTEGELFQWLFAAPEIAVEVESSTRRITDAIFVAAVNTSHPMLELASTRPDLEGLPWRKGDACRAEPYAAGRLAYDAEMLRDAVNSPFNFGKKSVIYSQDTLYELQPVDRYTKSINKYCGSTDSMGAIEQVLSAENSDARKAMVNVLSKMRDRSAYQALAKRAVFDTNPDVRSLAILALQDIPEKEFRGILATGIRYPHPAIVANATQAIASLRLASFVPELENLLEEPDPDMPRCTGSGSKNSSYELTEVVKINHQGNCVMCHLPSYQETDPGRGVESLKGVIVKNFVYYQHVTRSETPDYNFVRSDVTYLKQDYSLMSIDPQSGNPTRFDFVTRNRKIDADEYRERTKRRPNPEYKRAYLSALRRLSTLANESRLESDSSLVLR